MQVFPAGYASRWYLGLGEERTRRRDPRLQQYPRLRRGRRERELLDLHDLLGQSLSLARSALGGRILVSTAILPKAGPAEENPPTVVISVKDDGEGMPREVLERIFERFFTTKGAKDNGLGLANVMRTVEMHQGWIEADSEPGEGTKFRLHFPLA